MNACCGLTAASN